MKRPTGGRLVMGVAVLLVAATIAAAFLVLGSPAEQRLLRLDERRVEDLNSLRANVNAYWRANARLPASLDEAGRGTDLYKDPVTGEPYGYRALGERAYELCASFDRPFTPESPDAAMRFWPHPAGQHCFPFEAARRN